MTPKQTAEGVVQALTPFVSDARRARIERALASRTRDVVLVLENIYSDHNASAVLRTAEAIGLLEIHVVAQKSPFMVSRKITSGAHKWLELRRHRSIDAVFTELKDRGFEIWASHFHGDAVPVDQVPVQGRVALVFGNEHDGLTPAAIEGADRWFRVPMRGFVESLNISVAAAISMYDVHSRRRRAGSLKGLEPEDVRRMRAAWYAKSVRAAPQLLAQAGLPLPASVGFAGEEDER